LTDLAVQRPDARLSYFAKQNWYLSSLHDPASATT